MDNYEMFVKTINSLRTSQGFYSRLARRVEEMSAEEQADLEEYLNKQPKFKSSVDVVLFLEQ